LNTCLALSRLQTSLVNGLLRCDDLAHLLLDHRQVFGGERLVALEIVIETVLDHRADGDLRARPQLLHGFGHHMRRIVPDQLSSASGYGGAMGDPVPPTNAGG
jgi:hypothetical protein